jgi:hypothetical protein
MKLPRNLALAAAALLWALPAAASETATDARLLETSRDSLAKWVEVQQILSEEKRDWLIGKEVLLQRIALLESEIEALQDKTRETRKSVTTADEKRGELLDGNDALKDASGSLSESIGGLEAKTALLVAQAPDPVRERVAPLSQRLPTDPADTELSLGERYQNVIGILNELNKFNRDITVTSEFRTLADGTTAEVSVLYLGLGQAYYVNAGAGLAGVGRPGPDGWQWDAADNLAGPVAEAIAILKNEKPPAYVPLPVRIQ